ncbi:MAG: hypothetical protein EOO51_13520 [Flavobacterium sp.]|nr:MAG: hypothetical protein EOO51_13520 [Flavobacterium sp.]
MRFPQVVFRLKRFVALASVLLIVCSSCHQVAAEKTTSAPPKDLAEQMRNFIITISQNAKKIDPQFLIIPQNGSALAFEKGKSGGDFDKRYLKAIDGFGIESLFYNLEADPDSVRIDNLRRLEKVKPVFVSELVGEDKFATDAARKNQDLGFVPFIRLRENVNYEAIPKRIRNENSNDITNLAQAKNYLYLINSGNYDSAADFISAIGKTNFDLVIIDLFFNNNVAFTKSEIEKLKIKANGGRRLVVCYLNIGSAESWRYYWKKGWKLHSPEFLEKQYQGYENEYWVQYWNRQWQQIIFGNKNSYLDKVIAAGFDGAYLDNVEAYDYLTRP